MARRDEELAKARLLDGWLADLRRDRPPRSVDADLEGLSSAAIVEVMQLARCQRVLFLVGDGEVTATPESVGQRLAAITQRLRQEQEAARTLAGTAESFGALVQAALVMRAIRPADLEQALAAAGGTLTRLASGELPPHRLEAPTMLALLRSLDLCSRRAIALIRQASVAWVQTAYRRPQTSFGQIDPAVTDQRRSQFLAPRGTDANRSAQAGELAKIERYCRELTDALDGTS